MTRTDFIAALVRYTLRHSDRPEMGAREIAQAMGPEWNGAPLGAREVIEVVREMKRDGKLNSRRNSRRADDCIVYSLPA